MTDPSNLISHRIRRMEERLDRIEKLLWLIVVARLPKLVPFKHLRSTWAEETVGILRRLARPNSIEDV